MPSSKIKQLSRLENIVADLKSCSKKIVFTNGCFDILHLGHIKYLKRAKSKGDVLIVAINSDKSVKKLKGENRPVNKELDRAEVLASLESVDFVTIFGEDNPLKTIKAVRPDVLVKGGDWKIKDIIGGDFVKSCGGEVATIPYLKGYSTKETIKRIKEK